MGRPFRLQRRTLLRGIAGTALALPALEIMGPSSARAGGGAAPKRFVMMYGGMSIGADGQPNLVVPDLVGAGYDLKRALGPIGAEALPVNPGLGGQGYGVQDHVSVVSGLTIPWDTGNGVPPGGKTPEFHYNVIGPQTSGMRGGPGRIEEPNGPTADQIVTAAIGADSLFPSLSYRVQAASYVGSNSTGGSDARISYRQSDAGGLEALDPIFSPELAYASLFGAWPGPDPAAAAAAEFLLRRRKSVVDLVRDKLEKLVPRLGAVDRARLERHLDEVRGLETRLDAIPPDGQGDCTLPPAPGADPPVAGAAVEYNGEGGDGTGYSNEDLRAEILFDLIAMAFACDLTRSAAVRMTFTQSFLQMGELIGSPGEIHGYGHNGMQTEYADAVGWHVKHFARLVAKLRDMHDVDGSTLLDHTAVVLMFEGGHGYDPESGNDGLLAHSTENMVVLIGGHAGGLNQGGGKHIVGTGLHPANVVVSAMVGCGVAQDTETLGEVTGVVPELFA